MSELETAGTESGLVLRNISKSYGATKALDGLDIEINAGECLALVGENGAGKSTLLKILSGQIRPDSGEITYGGGHFAPRRPRDAIRQGISIVHQELCLAPHLSVEANIVLGREPSLMGWCLRSRAENQAREILRQLDHPELDVRMPVSRLSPGLRQVVEIARAIAADARVLLLDEPTSSLTEHDAERLFQLIDRLKSRGLAIVFISHALDEVDRVADRIAVMRDGRMVRDAAKADWDKGSIIAAMVGRTIDEMYPEKNKDLNKGNAEAVLDLHELQGRELPAGVSCTVKKGRILGLAGLIGSGRTEMARVVMGLDLQRSGRIEIAGQPLARSTSTRRRIRKGLGLLSEDRAHEGLAVDRTIEENMLYPTYGRSSRFGFVSSSGSKQRALAWVERLGIRCQGVKQPVRHLSGGNQQKVALARLLDQGSDVLILDEPTRGVDVGAKTEIYRLIREQADTGRAVVVISSYLPELMGLCDELAVMRDGRLSEVRPVHLWSQEQIMEYATSGKVTKSVQVRAND